MENAATILVYHSRLAAAPEYEPVIDHFTGKKHVNPESEFWCDWDDVTEGARSWVVDVLGCEDGMFWSCCREGGGETDGCVITTRQSYQKRVKQEVFS